MPFNLSAGLSSMGAAVSQQAGTEALELQKADLEKQKEILADQLATRRETGLETLRQSGARELQSSAQTFQSGESTKAQAAAAALAAGQEATQIKVAGMETAATMADVQAQIKAGAVETGIDAKTGNTMIYNKLTGGSTPLMGPDGNPLQLTNPAQAMLARDLVNSTNEQVRSLTQQYRTSSVAAQKDVTDALKSAGGDEKDPDVIAARAREKEVRDQYAQTIGTLNDRVNAQVNAALGLNKTGLATGNRPPISSFNKTPTIQTPGGGMAPVPALGDQGGLINTPLGR